MYFTARRGAVLDALVHGFGVGPGRISMGVQTFDDAQLVRTGRSAFGGRREIAEVVRAGQLQTR